MFFGGLEKSRICIGYRLDGELMIIFLLHKAGKRRIEPI